MGIPVSPIQIGLAFGALIVIWAWLQATARTGRATGEVTRITTRPGPEGAETRVPVITFVVDGERHSFEPSLVWLGEARTGRIGTKVPVAFNPHDPKDAEIAVAWRLYLPPVVATVLYGAFVLWLASSSLP